MAVRCAERTSRPAGRGRPLPLPFPVWQPLLWFWCCGLRVSVCHPRRIRYTDDAPSERVNGVGLVQSHIISAFSLLSDMVYGMRHICKYIQFISGPPLRVISFVEKLVSETNHWQGSKNPGHKHPTHGGGLDFSLHGASGCWHRRVTAREIPPKI